MTSATASRTHNDISLQDAFSALDQHGLDEFFKSRLHISVVMDVSKDDPHPPQIPRRGVFDSSGLKLQFLNPFIKD